MLDITTQGSEQLRLRSGQSCCIQYKCGKEQLKALSKPTIGAVILAAVVQDFELIISSGNADKRQSTYYEPTDLVNEWPPGESEKKSAPTCTLDKYGGKPRRCRKRVGIFVPRFLVSN